MRSLVAPLVVVAAFAVPAAAEAAGPHVSASVDHGSVGLGDEVRYTVEARVDTDLPVTVSADLGPFTSVASPRISRSRRGPLSVVRVEQFVVCLDRGCAPTAKARLVRLPRARARWGASSAVAARAEITVVPRVAVAAVAAPRARYRTDTSVPRRPALGTAVGALAAGAAALAVVALLVAAWALRRSHTLLARARIAPSFDQAARFLRESVGRPASDRRRAADFAGRASAAFGDSGTAVEAARVAWGPPDPEPADVGGLADRLEGQRMAE
jgi:hypothetical protein